ncbi:hypothetical protein D9Q98_004539 [Chlorella vulgaris]|uniref:S-adenosyl-L-methionine-dependent methyltransferase n=1 Tax=Chlorella vulgaris TaxID=3077 RepID=A0A9D4TPV4_CHLVU|nr:hypothetical protein D9Q98_004539 [Chlorella vulgaris]
MTAVWALQAPVPNFAFHRHRLRPCITPSRSQHATSSSSAAAAAVRPTQLQLGQDIPVALRRWTVGDCRFLLVVPDIDAVMEMYIDMGQPDRDPYWCEPWPSALAMAEELLQRPDLVAGKRVCELGCGLGLAGLSAALAGAAEVVLLDREPLALQCALLNAAINGLPTGASAAGVQVPGMEQLLPYLQPSDAQQLAQHQRAVAEQRRQSHSAASTSAAPNTNTHPSSGASSSDAGGSRGSSRAPGVVSAEVFDWSQPVTVQRHDVCLVCDCLYEAFSVEPVAAVAPKLLKPLGSRLLLADPPDRARHNRECFLDILCEESGEFVVEESGEKGVQVWEAGKEAWRSVPVAMLILRRAAGGETVGVKLARCSAS